MPHNPNHHLKDTRDICADISVTFSGTGQLTQAIINDFDLCASTTTIIIEGYSSIGQRAFYNRTSLTSIIIPNSVTSIGQNAFLESGVTTVSIANGQEISGTKFVSPATNVTFFGRTVTTILAGTFNGTGELTQEIVNAGLGSATTVIIEGYSSIGPRAFQGSTSLTSVTIGNSVQTISTGAFFGCNKLTSVTIPNSVLTIDTRAFFGCNKLTSVTIPASVTTFVDGDTFQGCSKLQSITVYKNNANYSSLDGVLFNKDKTTLVSFPGGRVGSYTIPNSVLRIGSYAFAEAILTSVIIPNSVTNIGTSAFLESGVTTVSIANGQVISGTTFESPDTNVPFFGRVVNIFAFKFKQEFQPFLDIFNYNPFTNSIPVDDNNTQQQWIYYKYKNNYNDERMEFNHLLKDTFGEKIWILCAGPGGTGGGHDTNKGGGGGGGSGEVTMHVVNSSTVNDNMLNLTIGKRNNNTRTEDTDNYNSSSSTYVKYNTTTGEEAILKATGGFQGIKATTEEGAMGGSGGGYRIANDGDIKEQFNIATATAIKFGSAGGGGGYGVHSNNGDIGNQTKLLKTGSEYVYKYLDRTLNKRTGDSVSVDFNISLSNNQCDNTGTANVLKAGDGGRANENGQDGPKGYIMIFHKTTTKLNTNFSISNAYFGVNPKTGYKPAYTNYINDTAYFYMESGKQSISSSNFNKMFKLTPSSSDKPTYLAVGGGGGGGSYFYNEYYSVGGAGGGGGQPIYGNIEYQSGTNPIKFEVGGNGDFGGNTDVSKLGNDGDAGSDTKITLTNLDKLTAKGGGGGGKAHSSDAEMMGLAGYGGGMDGRVNEAPTGVTQTGPSGGFGTYSKKDYTESAEIFRATTDDVPSWYDLDDEPDEDSDFTYYQQNDNDSFEHEKNYNTDKPWQNGCFMNLKLDENDKLFFSGTKFEVSRGGDAGKDDFKGASDRENRSDRGKYRGDKGSSGFILCYGKGPSGPI